MKIKKGLTLKMSLGYMTITVVSIVVFASSFLVLKKNQKIDEKISNSLVPILILYKDMNMLLTDMRRLCNSWIYTPDTSDKQRLQNILTSSYPSYKMKVTQLLNSSSDKIYRDELTRLLVSFDSVTLDATRLTSSLQSDEDYGNDVKVDRALAIYTNKVLPATSQTEELITSSILHSNDAIRLMQTDKRHSYKLLSISFFVLLLFTMVTGIVSLVVSNKIIIKPINELKDVINALGEGEIRDVKESNVDDEISEMRRSINFMLKGLRLKSDFAVEIGKGNYDKEFSSLGEKDQMGNALIEMRGNLKRNFEEEKKTSWANEGLARFGELMRMDGEVQVVFDNILRELVKYMKVNQGCIYVINDDDPGDVHLGMVSCYAWSRKKFLTNRINQGEGLVGQVWYEKEVMYLTAVPENYVRITSGLGEALPRCVIIVPLKTNNDVLGIIELASFTEMAQHERNFLLKISENMAVVLSSLRIAKHTKKLLSQSQEQAEELQNQEEEMRQNMEELTATQEEMTRKEKEYLNLIRMLENNHEGNSAFKNN